MKKIGHIFFILGPTGSGKGTLINNLKKSNIKGLHFPLSYKTRSIRESEENNIDAYFVTKSEFNRSIENNEFLEYCILFNGQEMYGTKYKDVLDNGIDKGRLVIKELDIEGIKKIKQNHPEIYPDYSTIYLKLSYETIEERVTSRGDSMSADELDRRIATAIKDNAEVEDICDYIIDAEKSSDEVFNDVVSIIKKKKKSLKEGEG